jgi:hypothetical protein
MAAQAIMAGLNIATSAIPLFFGENNIFSGKARQASKQLEKNFQRSQQMGLPSEVNQFLQNRLSQSNMGLPSASLGLYQQQSARNLTSNLGALRNRRSALAGIGDLAQAGQDAGLKLAAMEGEAMMSNRERANQALMQVGGMKYNEELRKQQEAADYWGTRKAESNTAVTSALEGIGNALGSAMSTDAFKGLGKKGVTQTALDNSGKMMSVEGSLRNRPSAGALAPSKLNKYGFNLKQNSQFSRSMPGWTAPVLNPTIEMAQYGF